MQKYIARYYPPFLWMGVMFFWSSLSTLPHAPEAMADFILKKSAHLAEYAMLYLLWQRSLNQSRWHKHKTLLSFVICFLFALSDEFHQRFVLGRTPRIRDVGIDMLGVMLMYLWLAWKQRSTKAVE